MWCVYSGILHSDKKEWNLAICDHMDGSRGYYAKWNKSGRDRHIPYGFPYMYNIKTNKQNKNRLIQTENKDIVTRSEGVRGR